MKKILYNVVDNTTNLTYHYTRTEWYLAFIIVYLAGFVEGIIFTYIFK